MFGKTCGRQNLYDDTGRVNPREIEHSFSKLESKFSVIARRIVAAVTEGLDHIDILEKDVHVLYKFMSLSPRRSEQCKDDIENPYRENDFMFQWLFEASKKSGRSGDPGQFWLGDLLYLLETSHEDILADAEKTTGTSSAGTYKYFIENYALQVWKAADGYEFFLNENLVDFEGDTEYCLGTEAREAGLQLIWMTRHDMMHLILPITPEVAVVFCNESRCWQSPFADGMQQLKIPYLENSLLRDAPHKDLIHISVPSETRGNKTWPATVAWRVNIGALSRHHHRIIASYSLAHAESFVIVRRRARFERAKRELAVFSRNRVKTWNDHGIRISYLDYRDKRQDRPTPLTETQVTKTVDELMTSLGEVLNIVKHSHQPIPRSKEMAFKSWRAMLALESVGETANSSSVSSGRQPFLNPGLKAAFESAYPPKNPGFKDLIAIDFFEFFRDAVGESTFSQLSFQIDTKISELVKTDAFAANFETPEQEAPPPTAPSFLGTDTHHSSERSSDQNDIFGNPAFQSVFRAAQGLEVLKWMFEERQDILATFIRDLAEPIGAAQPQVIRIRGRRQ
ncbi:hypothetical protein SLS62_011258 [Diatrype stigma]|uniref:Uncharacterized protein n=1 Tax=Diatrype stigma TaxID=117547 RepID=A0AAN9YE49_9PEZI